MQPIIDTDLLLERRRRALAKAVPGADFLIARAAEDLGDRLAAVQRDFTTAATVFCGTHHATDTLAASGKVGEIVRIEADEAFLAGSAGLTAAPGHLPLEPESLDLAVSLLSLQDENDIPGLLIQIRRALRPDGLFLGAMAGSGTLGELRDCLLAAEAEISGGVGARMTPLAEVRDVGGLLQRAGFALPVADVETVTVRYASPFGLIRDLRAMGATNALLERPRKPLSRAVAARMAELYAARYSDQDGRVRATFSIIWMSGWAPHASQQKPLKPGSATHGLARTLKDLENPPGACRTRCVRPSRRPADHPTIRRLSSTRTRPRIS